MLVITDSEGIPIYYIQEGLFRWNRRFIASDESGHRVFKLVHRRFSCKSTNRPTRPIDLHGDSSPPSPPSVPTPPPCAQLTSSQSQTRDHPGSINRTPPIHPTQSPRRFLGHVRRRHVRSTRSRTFHRSNRSKPLVGQRYLDQQTDSTSDLHLPVRVLRYGVLIFVVSCQGGSGGRYDASCGNCDLLRRDDE